MSGGVVRVVLRIAARRHIKDHSSPPFLVQPGVEKIQAELRFADAGRAGYDSERAGAKSAAEMLIQLGDSGAQAIGGVGQVSLGV
jgi:hypothetical protein